MEFATLRWGRQQTLITFHAPGWSELLNYFSHALPHLTRPWFICGVSVPDWLHVSDPKSRVRRKALLLKLPELVGIDREIAEGMLRHLDDDHWFHNTSAFHECSGTLTLKFREVLGEGSEWPCGFLGHIVLELLLDSAIYQNDLAMLDHYYQAFERIDPAKVQTVVGHVSTVPPTRLAHFIERFVAERFLYDYLTDEGLLFRLNQVMRRVTLPELPTKTVQALAFGRELAIANRDRLLPDAASIAWR